MSTTATAIHAARTAEAVALLEACLVALRAQPPVGPDDWAEATTPERVLQFAREVAWLLDVPAADPKALVNVLAEVTP